MQLQCMGMPIMPGCMPGAAMGAPGCMPGCIGIPGATGIMHGCMPIGVPIMPARINSCICFISERTGMQPIGHR